MTAKDLRVIQKKLFGYMKVNERIDRTVENSPIFTVAIVKDIAKNAVRMAIRETNLNATDAFCEVCGSTTCNKEECENRNKFIELLKRK